MAEYMDYNTWLEKEVNNLKQTLKETREFFVDKCKENKQLKKEIVHLKECNLRYRNHNELLESIIGIRNNVIE